MRPVRVKVWLNEDRYPQQQFEYGFTLDSDHVRGLELREYLDRLRDARIIDDWESNALETQDCGDTIDFLEAKFGRDLESTESGYETPYFEGGESRSYRASMTDAGRGHLL